MSTAARDRSGSLLTETIDFSSGPDGPAGSPIMPNASPQAPHRYTYGSGSRPLDGYTIKRAIGRGGFGEVYYATSDSGKEVALKLITRNVEVERRGVAHCMNLKCPNLLSIFDIRANDAGETFVVMEYVSGPSLAGVLEKYPAGMPAAEIRAWLKGLADGIAYLHDHGIVHRDLKPANLFLEDGVVKIGDYGLSKIISPEQGSDHSESIGTCHYMAPEISTGKYGKAIDIYATGVILYEMLTGRVPFEGETVGEVLMKHLTSRPDLSPLAEPYRTIVGQALAKDPANRPKRAADLLPDSDAPRPRDVRSVGDGKAAPAAGPAPGPARRSPWPWGKAVIRPVAQARPAPKKEDDVLRIGEEDPVFYIGPETRTARNPGPARPPGARRRPLVPPIRWVGDVVRDPARRQAQAQQQAQRQAQGPPAAARPAPPPTPPPVAPARPTGRVRIGELAGSSVFAAILSAPIALGLASAFEIDPGHQHPERAALLFAMTLLCSWAALLSAKPLEGSKAGQPERRAGGLALGLLVGGAGAWLSQAFGMDFAPDNTQRLVLDIDGLTGSLGLVPTAGVPIAFAAFFGLASFLNGWWKLADRDRPRRVRLVPVAIASGIALALSSSFPFRELWVVAAIPAAALVTQVVSPWSRQAAAFAAYARKNPAPAIAA